jgi:DamX protein
MSVVAHTNISHKHMASVQLNNEPAVTAISVSARIDYIQRFSKQAVLVIDNDVNVYAQAARQFLINCSSDESTQETNVAFVSASTKLNDIQMRCRLIEQLFANTLFDPEKSLAVSILNLNKHSKGNINIVIEHAHALSLQIKYELCQLVNVASKTQRKIDVVLFGLEQAAQDVAADQTLFKNKLSIVDAKSGQLFALEHAKFASDKTIFNSKLWLKLLSALLLFSVLIGLSWYGLIHYDNFKLSELSKLTEVDATPIETSALVLEKTPSKEKTHTTVQPQDLTVEGSAKLANITDIQAALLGEISSIKDNGAQQAQATDILQALELNESSETSLVNGTPSVKVTQSKQVTIKPIRDTSKYESSNMTPMVPKDSESSKITLLKIPQFDIASVEFVLTPEYYTKASSGYVVQLVGFTKLDLLSRFIKKYPNIDYFSYEKMLNDQKLIVLTTAIYDNKSQANAAIKLLPQGIVDRGVWIKPLSLVQEEINSL